MSQGLKSHVVFEALGMKGLLTYVGLYVAHKGLVNCQSLFVELNINFFSLILSCGFTFQKLACYAFSDLYFSTVLAWLWVLVPFPGVSSSRTPIHWSVLNLSICALKSSTSPVRHTHHHLNNKHLFKFRVELKLIFWKLNTRERSFADTDIHHLTSCSLLPSCVCSCTGWSGLQWARRDFHFVISHWRVACPLLHFSQARAMKRKSWRNIESLWRASGISEDIWVPALSPPCKLPCKLWRCFMYKRQKSSSESKMRLMRSRKCADSEDDKALRIGWDRRFEVVKHK